MLPGITETWEEPGGRGEFAWLGGLRSSALRAGSRLTAAAVEPGVADHCSNDPIEETFGEDFCKRRQNPVTLV